jgi:hypothetical protein
MAAHGRLDILFGSKQRFNANNAKGRKQRKQTGTVGDHGANITDRRRPGALVIHGGMTAQ